MKEAAWLLSSDVHALLALVQHQASARKRRLLACAACRRFWNYLTDPNCREAVRVAELFADGHTGVEELRDAAARARRSAEEMERQSRPGWNVARNAAAAAAEDPGVGFAQALCNGADGDLVREIFNPFARRPEDLPTPVLDLAEALYAGEFCAFALRDALLDAGQPTLAEHFAAPRHYKGCWAIDLLLAQSGATRSPGVFPTFPPRQQRL